jgi:hypothetical protein
MPPVAASTATTMIEKPEGYDEWKRKVREEAKRAYEERISGPIGLLPSGELNIIACPWSPETSQTVHCPHCHLT